MLKLNRKAAALVAVVALVFAALAAPAAVPAKGKVGMKLTGPLHLVGGSSSGGNLAGKVSGTFGNLKVKKAKVTGSVAPPKMTAVIHLSGGNLVLKSKDGHVVNGELNATYKLTGTGKYAKVKGSGKTTASLSDFVYTFKGSASL